MGNPLYTILSSSDIHTNLNGLISIDKINPNRILITNIANYTNQEYYVNFSIGFLSSIDL